MTMTRREFLNTAPVALGGTWLLFRTPDTALAQQGESTLIAYSLGAAQERVQKMIRRGGDWRSTAPDLWRLAGITQPVLAVVDAAGEDVILVGRRDAASPELTLDDVAIALRARFLYSTEDPGVTINGRVCAHCKAEGREKACLHEVQQDVEFFAGIENSAFGETCFACDWYLKELGLALKPSPVPGLKIYYDLAVEEARRDPSNKGRLVYSRFWFYPLVSSVKTFAETGLVVLERFSLAVFTQLLYAEIDGVPVRDLNTFPDPPSEGFSRSFTQYIQQIGANFKLLRRLQGLTELASICKGLTRIDSARALLGYLLNEHRVQWVSIRPDVPVLRRENGVVGLVVSGGVVLSGLATRARGGDPEALRGLVIRTRPRSDAYAWDVSMNPDDYLRGATIGDDLADIGPLFAEGHYMFMQKEYDRAIACWRQIAKACPETGEVYWWVGRAFERKGLPGAAAEYYTKALKLDPFLRNLNG